MGKVAGSCPHESMLRFPFNIILDSMPEALPCPDHDKARLLIAFPLNQNN